MAQDQAKPVGPDLTEGVALDELADGGKLVGHVGKDQVLLVRGATELFAVGTHCTHYHGPLVDGLVVGDTVRCPWHHACFDLRTGEALRAPALSALPSWTVEQRDGKIFVGSKREQPAPTRRTSTPDLPKRIVIIGGGAAGFAAAEKLRRERYEGSIVMLSSEDAPPIDRPNLSKDYLAGSAPEDWMPLRGESFYAKNGIDLRLKTNVTAIDTRARGSCHRRRRQGGL